MAKIVIETKASNLDILDTLNYIGKTQTWLTNSGPRNVPEHIAHELHHAGRQVEIGADIFLWWYPL